MSRSSIHHTIRRRMELFITTFESVAVLLGIGVIGFWIIRTRVVPEKAIGVLSPLALEIALPSLIFVNILMNFSPQESPDWWLLPLWWLVFTALAAVLTAISMFLAKKSIRREFAITLFYQNGLFFPLGILAGMFGGDSIYLVYLFLFALFYPAFFFSTYPLFFGKKEHRLQWRKIVHPVLIATLLAVGLRYFGVQDYVPTLVISILQLLGAMSIPLVMIILGGNIYIDFHKKGTVFTTEIVKFVLLKNIVFPLVFLGVLILVRPVYSVALILLLQSAVPPVTAVPLVTERAGGNRAIVNQFVVASFVSSLVTIPVMVMLFSLLFTP